MEKVEYDLDTSGGLMEEIQALVAPPQSEDTTKKKLSSSKEPILPKRPFRAINRDSCDACSEGGDLLCCDQCPSSFHLQCCDPPLEDEDVPTGEWICNECKYGVKKRTDQKLFRLFRSTSRKEQPDTTCVDNELGTRAFTKLVEMFRHKNPTEFQLPPDIQDYTVMPGQRRKQVNKDQPRKKEDEVQRLCFVCTKSQRIGDLINCDFCPLVFHRDCLMPPLGQEPLGLWMCPQHPENYEPRLRHTKYSQRSQVIEELRSNINHNAVKLEFFRRAKKERILMNRKFHQPNRRRTSVVPDVVKAQYVNPPAQIVPDYTDNLNKTLKPHMKPLSLPTSQEKDDWLRAVIDLQCSIADSLEKDEVVLPGVVGNNNSNVTSPLLPGDKLQSPSTAKAKEDKVDIKSPEQKTPGNEKEGKVPDIEKDEPYTKLNEKEKIIQLKKTEENKQSPNQQDPKEQSKESKIEVTTQDENRGVSISKSSPITTISKAGPVNSIFTSIMSPSSCDVTFKSSLRDSEMMMGNTDILKDPTLSQLDDRLVRVLAFQRLQQLMEKKKTRQIPKVSEPGISHKKTVVQITENKPGIAVFSPLNGTGNGCFMRNKSFNAGQGADMDLCLSNYGFCNYISGKHATVFYDRETHQFELLNYSEHGTIVDNVLYSCDFSEKTKSSSVTSANAKFDTSSKFQNAGQRLKRPPVGRTTKGLGTEFITKACNCRASASSLIGGSGAGWEGTAVLHHGSYIKFGCLHFIFSIVGCANNNNNNNSNSNNNSNNNNRNNNNNHNNNNNNNNNTPTILPTVNKKNTDGCKSMAKIAKLIPVVTPVHHGETVTSVT